MDLKSMLNESAVRPQPPPRLHTPSTSVSERPIDQHNSYDAPLDRPTPHATPSYAPDARTGALGSYFPTQSPQQHNSASTPSAGAHSAASLYAHSPGPGQQFTPRRDSIPPQNVYTPGHHPPPSPAGMPPSTPGSQYYSGQSLVYGQPYPQQGVINQRPPTREDYPQANGRSSQPPSYQMSPPRPHPQQTPTTPLGPPPPNHSRPSMHSQRPPSQGDDHLRRASIGSGGSTHSRDPSVSHVPYPDPGRSTSVQRSQSIEDERLRQERERSAESVSPKTIPRPPPQRNSSHGNYPYEQSPAGSVTSHTSHPGPPHIADQYTNSMMSTPVQQQSVQSMDARAQPLSRPSPGARPAASMTPQSTHSSLPPQPSPPSSKMPSKKRTASVISNAPSVMPPIKRIKREGRPIWAQSARKKRLVLDERGPRARPQRNNLAGRAMNREMTPAEQGRNGIGHTAPPPAAAQAPAAPPARPQPPPMAMDDSILPEKPRNDLVFMVCEWIWSQLGSRMPPKGSVFEIEAKLGNIVNLDGGERIRLPVLSEAIFDRMGFPNLKTKFDTSVMTGVAHKGLNEFLNHTVMWTKQEIDRGAARHPVHYTHTREWDEYYELTTEGRGALQHLTHWMNPNHRLKVRQTFSKETQEMTAQIIKIRVADLEIYNPNDVFDYRVSISLESPWNGPEEHLNRQTERANDRLKDRLSYKHRDYQIDLTQISHPDGNHQDHEVEIEINNDSFLAALDDARAQRSDRYEKCISGFVDNIRILAGHATHAVQARPPPPGM